MVDEAALRRAVDTAWSLYRAKHRDLDAADSRRCLLQRHLRGRWEARVSEIEELTGFGLAYLNSSPQRRMLRLMEKLVRQLVVSTARPEWTLLIISELVSAAIMLILRSMFAV